MDQMDKHILNTNDLFNTLKHLYEDNEDFLLDKHFLLDNVYHKKTETTSRINQSDFRKVLIDTYKCCVVTGFGDIDELEACHIVPYNVSNTYIDNGILLNRMIHKTFDKYVWSINPLTLKVEISDTINNNSSIVHYKDKIIPIRHESIRYIAQHYSKFMTKLNDQIYH